MEYANETAAFSKSASVTRPPRVGPTSPFEVASSTFDRTYSLTQRIRGLAERLCGPTPEQDSDVSKPARDGVLGALEATARNIDDEIDRAVTALDRIEAELP